MAGALVQFTLERRSLLPADSVVSTFAFRNPLGDFVQVDDATDMANAVRAFYGAIQAFLGGTLNGACSSKVYDLADPQPRTPVVEITHSNLTVGSTSLPDEVAMCLSFQGAPLSGVPQARRRGRVYLGPLTSASMDSTLTGGVVRPVIGLRTTITTAGEANLAAPAGADGWRHAVYSPTTRAAGGTVEESLTVVDEYWADNAFDTQRRRGGAPTQRTVVPVVLP